MSIQSENNFTLNDDVNGPVLAAVFATEMILALIANGVVLLITITQRNSWKQSSTIFFTSLILAHLVLNLLYLPFTIIALAAGEWIFGSTDEEKRETCDFVAYTLWYSIPVITITLAAISFDRFLFIVKPHLHKQFMRPWVALTLTLAIWILSAVVTFTPFIKGSGAAFIYEGSHGTCTIILLELEFAIVCFLGSLLVVSIIVVTSVWTFCFTRKFIHNQSEIAGDNVYASRKKRLFGIFGAMLIVYGLCFTPGIINYAVVRVIFVDDRIYLAIVISFIFVTVLSPIVQSYFRPEIKNKIVFICRKILQKPPQRDRVNYPVSSNNNSSGSKTEINRIGTSTQLTMSLDNALNTEHSSTTVV
ncbi:PREDICTED: neuropeptide Y receptor type 2-like [Amphimedon queenslandica]|uniref:G-protein coupled receptors family 1 profile domain-containing protein n=1 Tax=Amphimedon queenslandica TaxID=400682 RepID=A0AAN0JLW6_AMPQE|nr:PREDICTED: neuropeptide Y receptor type 2-like [Amphimedon queenslandica]|eukprot:XP_019857751.1 PREDICTED: neuropeptide Y receptor type 2-like [Amphimedon queenslandica]